jgi:hypothetical protein
MTKELLDMEERLHLYISCLSFLSHFQIFLTRFLSFYYIYHKNFSSSKSFRRALGFTQPPIQWLPGVLSPGVKRPGREADYSSPASGEVKKMRSYTSISPYAFMA